MASSQARSLELVASVVRASGEPLDARVRTGFVARVGRDPGAVRVHRDHGADASARALGADAYSVADHVVFRAGAYQPATAAGRRLLDHELIHVLQSRGSAPSRLALGARGDSREREAERLADPVTTGRKYLTVSAGEPGVIRRAISYELADAPYPTAEDLASGRPESERAFYQSLSEDERRVMGWLRQYAADIALQEEKRGVDRRAIAGAIAWEALENVEWSIRPSRAAGGPGKVHARTVYMGAETRPAFPEEVEQLGLVPKETYEDRVKLLKTPGGSIAYIGAIMQALAMGADAAGFDIWHRPDVLCFAYNSSYVDTWAARMKEKRQRGETTFDLGPNLMASWVASHMEYLTLAVGARAEPTTEPVNATVYFATDRADIDDTSVAALAALVTPLNTLPAGATVSIVGYADDRGDADYNRRLSEARAHAVLEALKALGLHADGMTIDVKGLGEAEPAITRAASRRVEIKSG